MKSYPVYPGDSGLSEQFNAVRSDTVPASWLHTHQQLGALSLGTNPTNGQTLTLVINGTSVVITFVSSIGTTAGNVLIGASAAATIANLMGLLAHPLQTTSTQVALSAANAAIIPYAQYALVGTVITPSSVNLAGYTPLTSFNITTTVTSGSWTAQTMQLFVESGVYLLKKTRVVFVGGSTPTVTAPSSYPRIDLLTIDSSGTLAWVTGTENASPVVPTYPLNKIVLCELYNVTTETALYNNSNQQAGQGYISNDTRPFILVGPYISQSGAEIYAPDTGSANVYAVALTPAITSYTVGQQITFLAANSSTAASTLNVNGVGAVAIKKAAIGSLLDLAANDIVSGQMVTVEYDGTYWQITSASGVVPINYAVAKQQFAYNSNQFTGVINLNGNALGGVAVGYKSNGTNGVNLTPIYIDANGNITFGSVMLLGAGTGCSFFNGLTSVGNTVYGCACQINTSQIFFYATYNGGTSWTTGTITFSGTAPVLNDGFAMYSDGTYVYIMKQATTVTTWRKYSVSGGTLTYVADYTPSTTIPLTDLNGDEGKWIFTISGTASKLNGTNYTLPAITAGTTFTIPTNIKSPFDHCGSTYVAVSIIPYNSLNNIIFVQNTANPITLISTILSNTLC